MIQVAPRSKQIYEEYEISEFAMDVDTTSSILLDQQECLSNFADDIHEDTMSNLDTDDVQMDEHTNEDDLGMDIKENEIGFDEDFEMQVLQNDDVAPQLFGEIDLFIDIFAQRDLLDDEASYPN